MKDTNQVETISISDGDKVYEFEKPCFGCEFIVLKGYYILGFIRDVDLVRWDTSGRCICVIEDKKITFDVEQYNLTPIQQKKEKANAPALLVKGQCPSRPEFPNEVTLCWSGEYFKNNLKKAGWRLATKAERDSFFCLDIDAISSKETN